MGEMVTFGANGDTASGYLATPGGTGPGVVVIQEWWGLVPHIMDVCDRFAAEGFVALAPDLYHGQSTTEPDEAGKLMMALDAPRAAREIRGAVAHLRSHPSVGAGKVGVTGFCMGGALTLYVASMGEADAAVPFYGLPMWDADFSGVRCPVLAHVAAHDDWVTPEKMDAVAKEITAAGASAESHVYPGTEHAFFNDTRPDVYDASAAALAWDRTLSFFRAHLAS